MKTNNKPFEIVIFGPPVSGKGTQAKLLSTVLSIPHISAGHLLRIAKSNKSNPYHKEIAKLIDNGELVPSDIINKMVRDRLKKSDCKNGFVLDGYPRTFDQVDDLEGIADIDHAFVIDISDKIAKDRISGRRICTNNHQWNLQSSPPRVRGICDICGEKISIRKDDTMDKVKQRLKIYHKHVNPILKYYKKKKTLITINGDQHIENVFQDMIKHIVDEIRKK